MASPVSLTTLVKLSFGDTNRTVTISTNDLEVRLHITCSLALPPLRMERKGLVKPVYTTCPIGMHLRFYTSRVTYGKIPRETFIALDVEKIFRSRVQIAKMNSP